MPDQKNHVFKIISTEPQKDSPLPILFFRAGKYIPPKKTILTELRSNHSVAVGKK